MNFKTDCLKDKVILVTGGTGSFGNEFLSPRCSAEYEAA